MAFHSSVNHKAHDSTAQTALCCASLSIFSSLIIFLVLLWNPVFMNEANTAKVSSNKPAYCRYISVSNEKLQDRNTKVSVMIVCFLNSLNSVSVVGLKLYPLLLLSPHPVFSPSVVLILYPHYFSLFLLFPLLFLLSDFLRFRTPTGLELR